MWVTRSSCDAYEKHSEYGLMSGVLPTRAAGTSGTDKTTKVRDGTERRRNFLMIKWYSLKMHHIRTQKINLNSPSSLPIKYGLWLCYYSQLLARQFMQKPREMENKNNLRSLMCSWAMRVSNSSEAFLTKIRMNKLEHFFPIHLLNVCGPESYNISPKISI